MKHGNEITAEEIETIFSQNASSGRFANFCNAVIVAEGTNAVPNLPVLSEKPGADGSFDGEWDVNSPLGNLTGNPFAQRGWNVFQFKARGIGGSGRRKSVSNLRTSLKDALRDLVKRLKRRRKPTGYVLFTNLQLGLKNESATKDEKLLSQDRTALQEAIAKGYNARTSIQIVDAAQLASLVNKHPALRLTFFTRPVARTWDEKWSEECAVKDYKTSVTLIAREQEAATLSKWTADANTKVIAISGPPGIGKSRLALEITRNDRWRTTVVDVVEEFQRWGVASFNTSTRPQLIIVEDPDEAQAEHLVKQAVGVGGIKLILTFPSESDAPILQLTENDAVKKLPLKPLSNKQSEDLLSAAGANFDRNALDWIVLQAGGNPEILLSAASLGQGLREKSGSLKSNLAGLYLKRIERKLGKDAAAVLRLVSPLQWVKVTGEKNDLSALITSFQFQMAQSAILDLLKRLEKLGYIRRRGNHAMVVPPLFAAALAEDVFESEAESVCALFDRLESDSQKRLLERVVTTDLKEDSKFWNHVFGKTLDSASRLTASLDLLDYLARAVPRRTAHVLAEQFEGLVEHSRALVPILRGLAYEQESCTASMGMLQVIALREPWEKQFYSDHEATQIFCECFVHWYFNFPLSFQDREQRVRNLLNSGDPTQIRLAARVIVMVTQPPHSLSGYSVSARKLGSAPPRRLWREVFDYLNHLVEMRFELTQADDEVAASHAENGFVRALQELRSHLNPDDLLKHLERLMDWSETDKLNSDVSDLRIVVRWIQEDYQEKSAKPDQVEFAERWRAVLHRVEALRNRLDNGPFLVRLKLALGREHDVEWEEIGGKRVYGFEKRCLLMAEEALANPVLMTDEAWRVVTDPQSHHAHIFVLRLGEFDGVRVFLKHFESQVGDAKGDHFFGLYFAGAQNSSAQFVETRLGELMRDARFPVSSIVAAIKLIGATTGNRARLQKLIRDKSVQPSEVASMFTYGRWLENVPPAEIRTILEFIASGPEEWPKWILHIVGLHLSVVNTLPPELIPVSVTALENYDSVDMNDDWHWGQVAVGVARTDLDRAFALIVSYIREWADAKSVDKEIKEMRFNRRTGDELWTFLCVNHPERTCRELLAIKDCVHKLKGSLWLPFNLEKNTPVLMKIAIECEDNAMLLVNAISGAHKGFFPFAYALMDAYKTSANVRDALATKAVYQTGNGAEWNFTQALGAIESEIANTKTPAHYLEWLKELRQRIQQTSPRFSFFGKEREDFLGWD